MGLGDYSPGSKWFYAPNKVAPIVFSVLFALSGVWHAYQNVRYKSWRTTILLPWAAALMVSGYVIREIGAFHTDNLTFLIASTVLIMSGPPVYSLINYLTLSRILYYIPYLSPMHPGRVITTFVGLDAVCEILIGQGAWRMANSTMTDAQRKLGANLVKASLILQAALFGAFGVLAAIFQRRATNAGVLTKKLRTVLYVLYVSAVIVTIRCIYRIVEYCEGWTGQVYTNEAYFWVFEASIMFVNTLILNFWNPGKRLPRSNRVFLDRDGATERHGPGWSDDRPWIVTTFDPFDVWGICTGKDNKTQFWDMADEQLAQLVAEQKANKRSFISGLLDPFHLWGPRGLIGKHLPRSKSAEQANHSAVTGTPATKLNIDLRDKGSGKEAMEMA